MPRDFRVEFRIGLYPRLVNLLAVFFLSLCAGRAEFSTNANFVAYMSRMWQTDEGLPHNVVLSLAQTPEGYLWVGTQNGLTRFDGVQFRIFNPQNTPELKSAQISALCVRKNGSLWIGLSPGGLVEFREGKFIAHSLSADARGNTVKTLYESKDGTLWAGTVGGLYRSAGSGFVRYTKQDGLRDDVVRSICEFNGDVWVGTGLGINVVINGTITNQTLIPNRSVRTILADTKGNFWVGGTSGLECIQPNGRRINYSKTDGLADNTVCSLFEDREGSLWIGTFGGLSRILDGKITTETDDKGIFYDQVNSIFEDHEGDLWLGTKDGLHELKVKRFTTYTRQQGLSDNNIMSVLQDHEGNVWSGTWGGGIVKLNGQLVANYNWENNLTNGLPTDHILALCEDADGSMLFGADYEGGLFRFKNGKFIRLISPQQSQTDRVIRVIYRDRETNLWVGTDSNLICLNKNQHMLTNNGVHALFEDHAGTLLVGTTDGLFRREQGKFVRWRNHDELEHGLILAFYEDKENTLWIGTEKKGLVRYRNGEVTSYDKTSGLPSDEVSGVLEDDYGWLWLSSPKGIFRVSKKNLIEFDDRQVDRLTTITYGKSDGMESIQCSAVAEPASWKGRDGRMWFCTAKGLVMTNPKINLNYNDRPPVVLVEKVVADKKSFPFINREPQEASTNSLKLKIEPGHGDLEFYFTALSLQQAEKNLFKYKLEGVDSDWVAVSRRVATYYNIMPGNYRFRVIACNNDGIWNEIGATVALELKPHFWQTRWFLGSMSLFVLFMGGGIVRFTTNRNMQLELQRLEKQHAIEQERIRIARDMHDEIGAKLTKISFLGASAKRRLHFPDEAGSQIDKMSGTAREVIRALDEIVWAVNPANDTVEHLATYLCRNAAEFFENSPILCQFKIPAELPPYWLGTDKRHNVLLAAREAMNNALKHSGATTVLIEISAEADVFQVTISDNGRGLGEKSASSSSTIVSERVGNGMNNMTERLRSVGGKCEVVNNPGKGVKVILTVKLEGRSKKGV